MNLCFAIFFSCQLDSLLFYFLIITSIFSQYFCCCYIIQNLKLQKKNSVQEENCKYKTAVKFFAPFSTLIFLPLNECSLIKIFDSGSNGEEAAEQYNTHWCHILHPLTVFFDSYQCCWHFYGMPFFIFC